jgi:hypothetical protein
MSLDLLNRWLNNIVADPAPLSPDKVVSDKPADAVDSCWDLSGNKIVEPAPTDPNTQCNRLYPYFSQPQIEAGQGLTRDVLKCALKPIKFGDYSAGLTPAEQSQLRSIFPNGVCDYTQPGIGQQPLLGTYLLLD